MARSRWKLSYINYKIFRTLLKKKKQKLKSKVLYIFDRSTVASQSFVNSFFFIHKGNSFKKISFKKYFFGKKLGEFSFTKKPFFFPLKKKKR